MKKLTLIILGLITLTFQSKAHGYSYINSYADGFVFDEMGVTFAVYPDGEFDFYLQDNQQTVSNGYVNVTFNSGYNYNPYVQYDDFGAVIQVENVPIYYDWYGRVSQIGDVQISYNNRRVCRVGGLQVYYNNYGYYSYHTGCINSWNPYFVYRPFYVAFIRPTICFVNVNPYRQYYSPVRYTYYRPYVHNIRPCYATVGHTYRPSGHGQAHYRYTQTAGRGEAPVVRQRRTVTTADAAPRPQTVNRANVDSRNVNGSTYSRSTSPQRETAPARTTAPSQSTNGRTSPSVTRQQPTATQPRTVQTAPSRNTTANRTTPASRPTATAPARGGSSAPEMSRPSGSTSQSGATRTAPSRTAPTTSANRGTVSQKPATSQSGSRVQSGSSSSRGSVSSTQSRNSSTPSRVQSNSSSRSSVAKPSSGSSSRSSGSMSSAPTRSSSSGSMSKGSASRSSSGRGN